MNLNTICTVMNVYLLKDYDFPTVMWLYFVQKKNYLFCEKLLETQNRLNLILILKKMYYCVFYYK